MKHLDRNLQRDLLNQMAEAYPEPLKGLYSSGDLHSAESVNLHYLAEHGLITLTGVQRVGPPGGPAVGFRDDAATITAAGLDFLQADGGLTAVLGTVTVRLHADTIRDLIEAKIVESDDVPAEEKPRLIAALKEMREEGLKQLTQRVVSHGLDQAPGAWSAIIQALTN